MNPAVLYFVKVVLCSGVLFGYYYLALRNKVFHQWNRFYLLACVVLSLTAPLLHIPVVASEAASQNHVLRLLHVATMEGNLEVDANSRAPFVLTTELGLWAAYAFVSLLLLVICAVSSVRIYRILRSYPKTRLEDICFLNTDAKGTPFAFFRYIVWNEAIDLNSETGQRIFQHELVHVRQRHTWDKVFLLLMLIPFWLNPFFWLIRKELAALHEFTADQKAMQSGDAAALAQMIINTAFPQQHLLFTNHLFQSPIKRRIAMFTKLQNPRMNYASRIAALPLLVIILAAFALKTHSRSAPATVALDKPITVVIDAGHGGNEGTHFENVYEDAIVLAIAKHIKEQNKNQNIHIVLTRDNDQKVDLHKRVELAAEKNADLFISIHVNAADGALNEQIKTAMNGMQVVVSAKSPPYQTKSEALASVLVQQLGTVYNTQTAIIKPATGVWVLDRNVCPAVLVECGYLTDAKDRTFITQDQNQSRIADKILEAIAQYGLLKNNSTSALTDSAPSRLYKDKALADVQYFEWPKKEVHLFFTDGTKDTISYAAAKAANLFDTSAISTIERRPWASEKVEEPALMEGDFTMRNASETEAKQFKGIILLNGKRFDGTVQQLPVSEYDIAYISFIKGTAFDDALGTKLKPGDSLLIVSTKAYMQQNRRTDNEPLFTQPEIEPKFPQANGGWQAFLSKNLDAAVPVNNGAKAGAYKVVVGFIVDVDGKLYDIKPMTHLGYGMEEEVVRLLKLSPDWSPALQNGKKVTAYKKQAVTFVIANAKTNG